MTPCVLVVKCCELLTDNPWNKHHKIPSSLLIRNFKPAPILRLKSVLIFPSSAAVLAVKLGTFMQYICVGKLVAINYKARRHDDRTIIRTASLLSYNSSVKCKTPVPKG
jgi:hypothetical protein